MVLKIAHRGASHYAPENSIQAFKKALEIGADAVEFDVRLTKDRRIVVLHDPDLKRTTNGFGLVGNLPFKEIRRYHLSNGETVPTIQEVLKILRGKCICKIEIKERLMEKRVLEAIRKNQIKDSVIVTSEIFSVLKRVNKLSPKIKIEGGGFKERIPSGEIIKKAKSIDADIIAPHYSITSKKLVDEAHKNGLEVHVWVVNRKKTIEKLKRFGVDGITSDCPDRI